MTIIQRTAAVILITIISKIITLRYFKYNFNVVFPSFTYFLQNLQNIKPYIKVPIIKAIMKEGCPL